MRRPSPIFWFLLALIAGVALFPYAWIVLTSFKARHDILTTPPVWVHDPSWLNYTNMLFLRGFDRYLLNSVIIGLAAPHSRFWLVPWRPMPFQNTKCRREIISSSISWRRDLVLLSPMPCRCTFYFQIWDC